jgi:hypothetical protein
MGSFASVLIGVSLSISLQTVLDNMFSKRPALPARTSVRHSSRMTSAAGIIALVVVLVPLAIVGAVFVWAARKDGAEDKAVQARLGIRRKTRLGR